MSKSLLLLLLYTCASYGNMSSLVDNERMLEKEEEEFAMMIQQLGATEDFTCYKTVCDKNHRLKNWMKAISDSRRLIDMSLPGTHNTMALYDHGTFGFTRCQKMPLKEQLNTGIRVLDIRCRHLADRFPVHHGIIYQKAYFGKDVLKVCIDFLKQNPSETIIINMQVASNVDPKDNTRTFRETYIDRVKHYGSDNVIDLRYTDDYVTMGMARGKVVLNTYGLKFNQGWKIEQNKWEQINAEKSASIARNMRQAYDTPLSSDDLFVNYLSTSYWKRAATPWKQAVIQNPFTADLIEELRTEKGNKRIGMIFSDYPGYELIERIVKTN